MCGKQHLLLLAFHLLLLQKSATASPFDTRSSGLQNDLKEQQEGTCQSFPGEGGTTPGNDQYIVRFKEYALAEEHQSKLKRALAGEGSEWRWVSRNNRAAAYPTDFGLVTATGGLAHLAQRLAGAAFVRDVHRDKRYAGSLNWVPEGDLKTMFADADVSGAAPHGSETQHFEKQPQADQQQQAQEQGGDETAQASAWQGGSASFAASDDGEYEIIKRSGRLMTPFMMEGEYDEGGEELEEGIAGHDRSLLTSSGRHPVAMNIHTAHM